jgi:phage gp36-like protein
MPYVQQSDLTADIPPEFITQALDDNNDGVADAGLWDLIAQDVSDAIDMQIGVRYAVPLQPDGNGNYPTTVVSAARILAAEKLYARRPAADMRNPWTARANQIRAMLDKIGAGSLPLDPSQQRQDPSASVVSSRLQTVPRGGRLAL